jgi:hypothetical protein
MDVSVSARSTAAALRAFLWAGGGRAIVAVLLASAVWASPTAAQDVRLGLRLGPTFGFLSDSAVPFSGATPNINANPRIDVHAGAYAILPLTEHVALQPEVLYVRKGGHFSRPLAESYAVERYRLSYLQGALLGRGETTGPGPLSLHAVVGLSLDAALDGRLQRALRTAADVREERIALAERDRLRRWGAGVVVGLGASYPTGSGGRLALTLRYNPGLVSVFEDGASPAKTSPGGAASQSRSRASFFPNGRSPLRHDVVTASLAYTFPVDPLF